MIQPSQTLLRGAISACCVIMGMAAASAVASERDGEAQDSASSLSRRTAYRVYVAAFQTEARARALCDPLVEQGHPVIVAPTTTTGAPHFVCRSAQTYDRTAAQEIADRIRFEGRCNPIIVAVPSLPGSRRASSPGEASAALDPELRREFERFIDAQEQFGFSD